LLLLLGSFSLSTNNLMNFLNDEKSNLKHLLFNGLTHEKGFVKILFKNFYTYLTMKIKDKNVKKAFLKILIKNIQNSKNKNEFHVMLELA